MKSLILVSLLLCVCIVESQVGYLRERAFNDEECTQDEIAYDIYYQINNCLVDIERESYKYYSYSVSDQSKVTIYSGCKEGCANLTACNDKFSQKLSSSCVDDDIHTYDIVPSIDYSAPGAAYTTYYDDENCTAMAYLEVYYPLCYPQPDGSHVIVCDSDKQVLQEKVFRKL